MSQAFALFIAGLAALLLYAVQKQDLGVGTGLCALIWTDGGGRLRQTFLNAGI